MHTFADSKRMSEEASRGLDWFAIYKRAFPALAAIADNSALGQHQWSGIDRTLVMESGKTVWVDEKVRGRSKGTGKVYEDIALEVISNDRTGRPGWVTEPLLADYIAYAIIPLGRCFLLPVLQLQEAWRRHGEAWTRRYRTRKARNSDRGYSTIFVPVPVPVLFQAMGECLRVQLYDHEVSNAA